MQKEASKGTVKLTKNQKKKLKKKLKKAEAKGDVNDNEVSFFNSLKTNLAFRRLVLTV